MLVSNAGSIAEISSSGYVHPRRMIHICMEYTNYRCLSPWQELIEWSLTLSWWCHAPRASPPSDPFHKQGTWGRPGWAPGMTSKLFEHTGGRSGLTQKLIQRTHWFDLGALRESSIKDFWSLAAKTLKLYILFCECVFTLSLHGSLNFMDELLIWLGHSAALMACSKSNSKIRIHCLE